MPRPSFDRFHRPITRPPRGARRPPTRRKLDEQRISDSSRLPEADRKAAGKAKPDAKENWLTTSGSAEAYINDALTKHLETFEPNSRETAHCLRICPPTTPRPSKRTSRDNPSVTIKRACSSVPSEGPGRFEGDDTKKCEIADARHGGLCQRSPEPADRFRSPTSSSFG